MKLFTDACFAMLGDHSTSSNKENIYHKNKWRYIYKRHHFSKKKEFHLVRIEGCGMILGAVQHGVFIISLI